MAGIDHELGIREAAIGGNPRIAQQKYAQSKDFLDLLVAQKVSNDYASARNAMQAAMQTPDNTVKNQLDVSNAQTTKNEMMRSVMPGVAQKAQQTQQAMARQAMGVPTQPARQAMGVPTQPAPNIRMRDGGIVGYANRGLVRAEDVDMDTLLDSLMFAESSGNPRAVGPVGEKGPYQISAPTARQPGFGVSPIDEGDLFDPEKSRRFARQYLQAMIDRYDGDIEAALIAYNAGFGNADKFIAAGRDYDVLPQTETTKPHVKNILDRMEQEVGGRASVGATPSKQPDIIEYLTMAQNTQDMINRADPAARLEGINTVEQYASPLTTDNAQQAWTTKVNQDRQDRGVVPTQPASQAQLMADALGFGSVEEGRADFARRKAARRNTSPTPAEEKTYAPGIGGDLAEIQDFLGRILGFQGGGIVGFTPGGEVEVAGIDPDLYASTFNQEADPEFRMQGVEEDTPVVDEQPWAGLPEHYRINPLTGEPRTEEEIYRLIRAHKHALPLVTQSRTGENIPGTQEAADRALEAARLRRNDPDFLSEEELIDIVAEEGTAREDYATAQATASEDALNRRREELGLAKVGKATGAAAPLEDYGLETILEELPDFISQEEAEVQKNEEGWADFLGYGSVEEAKAAIEQRTAERQAIEDAKWSADDIDWERLQAFLAGGGGRTTTAGALGGGLRGLMAEDQRREALDLEERLTMADIGAERYGAQLDYDAVMATLDAEQQEFVMEMQQDALDAYNESERDAAENFLAEIQAGTDDDYSRDAMLLQDTYKNDPSRLAAELIGLTETRLDNLMETWRGQAGGGGTIGAFDTDISEAGA